MRKLKVLIIGAAFSADLHSDGYSRILDKVDIVGICDKNTAAIKTLADRYGFTGYTAYDDYDKAIAECECDLIEKLSELLSKTYDAYGELERVENTAVKKPDEEAAFYYKNTVIPRMDALRKLVDAMEVLTSREYWPMPTYGDITFRV